MTLLAVPIIAVSALFLVLISGIAFFIVINKLRARIAVLDLQIQSNAMQFNELQASNNKLQQTFDAVQNLFANHLTPQIVLPQPRVSQTPVLQT